MIMERKAIYTIEDVDQLIKKGIEWNFHESNTQEHLHSLHPYPAKFIPQIPRKAIESWSAIGELIYDPFCGCGTTLLEASLLGRPSIGTDNNSVAVLISKAKTSSYSNSDLQELVEFYERFDDLLSKARPLKKLIPNNKNFYYWFNDEVLLRLSSLKRIILDQHEPIRTLLLSIFSSIIVRVSYQDSDTRYAKIEKKININDVDKSFKSKLIDVIGALPEIQRSNRATVEIHKADSRKVPFIKSNSVSLIVTSPPYLNAYDYHKYHRQRIHWIGGDVEYARDLEIGSHDEFTRTGATPDQYFVDMNLCFGEWSRVLRRNGQCLIVIGDAIVTKEPVFVADKFITLLNDVGLELVDRWIRELHLTKKAFNGSSRINQEHLLLLKKT